MAHIAFLLLLSSLAASSAGQSTAYPCDADGGCDETYDDAAFDLLHVKQRIVQKSQSEGAEAMSLGRAWPYDDGVEPTPVDYNPLNEILPSMPEGCEYVAGLASAMLTFDHGVLYNNLGGTGPQTSDPEELRFYKVVTVDGIDVDLKITNETEYFPKMSSNNGVMEAGNVGQINLMCGHSTKLKMEWVKTGTDTPIVLDYSYLTFADIDNSKHGLDKEMFSFYPVSDYWVADGYEFDLDASVPGVITAISTHFGRGCDNPFAVGSYFGEVQCSDGVIVNQLLRSILIGFKEVSSITVSFGIPACKANGQMNTHGRNFMIAGDSFPPGFECTTTSTTVTMAPPTAQDDPHCTNLRGDRFTVNQPGEYVLFRVPLDMTLPAQLDVRGTMVTAQGEKCGLYITEATFTGDWFGENVVHVRALRRNGPGGNTMGNATAWPFSLKVSTKNRAGSWTPMERFEVDSAGIKALTDRVSVAAVSKENFGKLLEAQSFEFRIGVNQSAYDPPAKIIVSQASHQALNIDVLRIKKLGQSEIGGLLGTEKHDPKIEELTTECKGAIYEGYHIPQRWGVRGSLLGATWH